MIVSSEVQTRRFGKIRITPNFSDQGDSTRAVLIAMSQEQKALLAKTLSEHDGCADAHQQIVSRLVKKILELFEYSKSLEKRISLLEEKMAASTK